jgi:hypothetical protein
MDNVNKKEDLDRVRFEAWWIATGGNHSLRSLRLISEEAWMASARLERMACINICREVAEQSNISMAGAVAKTIETEISER